MKVWDRVEDDTRFKTSHPATSVEAGNLSSGHFPCSKNSGTDMTPPLLQRACFGLHCAVGRPVAHILRGPHRYVMPPLDLASRCTGAGASDTDCCEPALCMQDSCCCSQRTEYWNLRWNRIRRPVSIIGIRETSASRSNSWAGRQSVSMRPTIRKSTLAQVPQ